MPAEYYEAIKANKWKTWLLFLLFFVLMGLIIFFVGYFYNDVCIASFLVILVLIWGMVSWFAGDKVIMRVSGAKKVSKQEYPYLFNVTEGLAMAAGVPMPDLYVIDDKSPNAFATGRDPDHSSIAVTTGLLDIMNRAELEGVIAHEMSHVRNYDIRTMMLATVLVGIITLIGHFFLRSLLFSRGRKRGGGNPIILIIGLVFIILSPFIAQMIKMAISRKREYLADASAVELTRNPDGIGNALQKLAEDKTPLKRANGSTAHLYIENPMKKEEGLWSKFSGLFSTHPPIQDRINKVREMGLVG